jgi:hypothetical protein
MTKKEKEIQRALGLLNTYCFILQVPPEDGIGRDVEVGIQIESTDLDSACDQLELEITVDQKYQYIDSLTIDKTNASIFGIE